MRGALVRTGALALVALAALACDSAAPPRSGGPAAGWPAVAGGPGGMRYSPLGEITPANVGRLEVAWEYHTGDLRDAEMKGRNHAFQATPILLDDALIFCTPRSHVVALDAETGAERWTHDPQVDLSFGHYNFNCRGVAAWSDARAPHADACSTRVFVATADARLVAVDAATGRRCAGFGTGGAVEFWRETGARDRGEVGVSSPPVVIGDVVVVGSSIRENRRVDMPSGMVQAFDARSGARRWSFDPIPRNRDDPARASWRGDSADRTGGGNVWSLMSADPDRDLVFLPTSSPSPDYFGGERVGDNRYADSVVALRAATGELVWSFQAVHHNLWDYDVASQPVLIDFPTGAGRSRPAVVQATKMGNLFILDRETGAPLVPVEERPVPQTTVPGEVTAATQPFPTWPPPLVPQRLTPEDAWGLTPWDRHACAETIRGMRSEGIFTPPSLEGSVIFPGTAGGSDWGSVAYDPVRRLLVANTNRIANTVQLVPHSQTDVPREDGYLARAEQQGTPYAAYFGVLLSPFGIPCNAPPWGTLAVLDLAARELRWQVPLGTVRDLAPLPLPIRWGVPNMGGPLATGGGLVFIGAALDDYLRAFDVETGAELWRGRLPAGGQATPMTYRVRADGRQFVVIAAGGHAQMRSSAGDSLMAFALP